MTQLRRRLIVSLGKTKGIWNNGQIGAFMQRRSSSPTPIRTPCGVERARGWLNHRQWIVRGSYQPLTFVRRPVYRAQQLCYTHTAAAGKENRACATNERPPLSTLHSRVLFGPVEFQSVQRELRRYETRADTPNYARLCTSLVHDEFYTRGKWEERWSSYSRIIRSVCDGSWIIETSG